jgi:hypothetical protein
MLAAEKTSFAKLMVTPTAQNLIRVFFLREQMKKLEVPATGSRMCMSSAPARWVAISRRGAPVRVFASRSPT